FGRRRAALPGGRARERPRRDPALRRRSAGRGGRGARRESLPHSDDPHRPGDRLRAVRGLAPAGRARAAGRAVSRRARARRGSRELFEQRRRARGARPGDADRAAHEDERTQAGARAHAGSKDMKTIRVSFTAILTAVLLATAGARPSTGSGQDPLPTPEQFFGFRMGADSKLARWDRIVEYFKQLSGASDRVRYRELGKSTNGNPFIAL